MTGDAVQALDIATVAALLQSGATQIEAELRALAPDLAGWHPGPGEWCVKEAVGHIVEAERRGFAGRIRLFLHDPAPHIEPWDPEAVAQARHDCARPSGDVLAEFLAVRADSIALVRSLTPADLDRGGEHPQVGYLCVRDLLHEWVHHDRNHIKQMLSVMQSYAWPSMGNTRRFSEP